MRIVRRLEKLKAFTMTTNERTRNDGSVNVDEISDVLGIDREEGRGLAEHLNGLGWAVIRREAETKLLLTDLGYQKIAKWRMPLWQRMPDEHPWIMGIVGGAVAGLITNWLSR